MLNDEKTYKVLKSDPTARYKRDLVAILSRLKKEEKISSAQYHHMFPTAENIPRIYATPKIHKVGNKVRPIVDYTGSIGYNTSRALADILAPLVGETDYHVENSKHLADDLAQVYIEDGRFSILTTWCRSSQIRLSINPWRSSSKDCCKTRRLNKERYSLLMILRTSLALL